MTNIERKRQHLQSVLDASKTLQERNKMGQFSTPYPLARQICEYIINYTGDSIESFLEPSIGTGVFYSALSEIANVHRAVGYEIDRYYYKPAKDLWCNHKINIINQNFFNACPEEKFSLIIANPPYSRHHHISTETKVELAEKVKRLYNLKISGLAGLHIYFTILSTQWLKEGGYSCWLIPTEFLSVNYGIEFKRFLLSHVDLIAIHSYDNSDVQFNDALVSSSVLVFRNCKNKSDSVSFSWGANINNPSKAISIHKANLNPNTKWTKESILNKTQSEYSNITIGTFFNIKRGIATGDNDFFIIREDVRKACDIPRELLTPTIPPPRKLKTNVYTKEDQTVDGLFLLSCNDSLETIRIKYEGLYKYIEKGIEEGVDLRANCRNRTPWYGLEQRKSAPILVSYMGRDSNSPNLPIKFILNSAGVVPTNSYLCLYLKDEYIHNITNQTYKDIWEVLSSIPKEVLIAHGRTYGGGLLKWEPKELESTPCPELSKYLKSVQTSLFDDVL